MRNKIWSCLALAVIATSFVAPPSAAQSQQYTLPVWFEWDRTQIDVVIVPPEHGQIYNANGVFGGHGPGELTTNNTYMKAIENSIADWDKAIEQFGSDQLKKSLKTNVYVLGRDAQAASALLGAEIIVLTDQSKAFVLGIAVISASCVVDNSKMFVSSFTYEDMYNTNGQEYGHCLGLDHVVEDQPEMDVMNGHYPHNIGAKDTPLHCFSNLDVAALHHVFFGGDDRVIMQAADYRTIDCSSSMLRARRAA